MRFTLTEFSISMFTLFVLVSIEVRIRGCLRRYFLRCEFFPFSGLFLFAPLSQFLRHVGQVASRLPSVIFVTIPLPFDEIEGFF